MGTKHWYRSSTVWLNVGFAAAIAGLTQLGEVVPVEYAALVGFALNFLNRFRTSQPIGK